MCIRMYLYISVCLYVPYVHVCMYATIYVRMYVMYVCMAPMAGLVNEPHGGHVYAASRSTSAPPRGGLGCLGTARGSPTRASRARALTLERGARETCRCNTN